MLSVQASLRKPNEISSVAASRLDAAGRLDDFAAAGRLGAAAVTGMAAGLQAGEETAAVVAVAAGRFAASRGRLAAGGRSDFAAASGLDDFAAAGRFAARVLRMAASVQAGQQTAVMTTAGRFAASRGGFAAGGRSDFAAAGGLDVAAAVVAMAAMQAGQQSAAVMMAAAVRRSAAGRGDDRFATAGRSEREDLGGQQEASRNAETEDSQVHFQSSSNETEDLSQPDGRPNLRRLRLHLSPSKPQLFTSSYRS